MYLDSTFKAREEFLTAFYGLEPRVLLDWNKMIIEVIQEHIYTLKGVENGLTYYGLVKGFSNIRAKIKVIDKHHHLFTGVVRID